MRAIVKYPRTRHLRGSALQSGDDPTQVSMDQLRDQGVFVFEEKADGASAAVSFDPGDGRKVLQSRGHSLEGGPGERQFDKFKAWSTVFEADLRDALGTRYALYGEWMAAKHSVFYDALPHLFLTYDLLDRETGRWLSTPARVAVLDGLPIAPVHVLHEGWVKDRDLPKLVGRSVYKSDGWRGALTAAAEASGQDVDQVMKETDNSDLAEGVYLKVEAGDETVGRYKYVRHGFLQVIADSGSHWASRPLIENRLAPGADLYAHPAAAAGRAP